MTGLLTSPIAGALVLGLLLLTLLRRGLREAAGERVALADWALVSLLVLFAAQVAARFAHG